MKLLNQLILSTTVLTTVSCIVPATISHSNTGTQILSNAISADERTTSSLSNNLTNSEQANLQNNVNTNTYLDINLMPPDIKQSFEKIVKNAVVAMNLPTNADTEDAYIQILGLFDSKSDNYNNLEKVTKNLIIAINENHQTLLDHVTGENILAARHGTISVSVLGASIDIALSAITGGSISNYIRRYGANALAAALKSRVALLNRSAHSTKLIKKSIGALTTVANPGLYLAQLIDNNDKIKRNGWIELW